MKFSNTQPTEIANNKAFSAAQTESGNLERYKALVHASDIGAWEYFPDTESLWCNDIYFSMLGRDINDYDFASPNNLKEVWIDLLHPEDKDVATNHFAEYLKNPKGTHESYYRMKHSNGSWVWIWSRGRVFQNEQSGFGAIGTHVDITRHKKAEEAIQRERILLRTLIDNLPDTIYVKDSKGRKIIANRADVECIGYSSEDDVLGKTDLDLFNNDIGLRGYEDDMRIIQSGEAIINKEEYFLDSTGKMRWLLTSKLPVKDGRGKIIRLLGIGHDITMRKQSDEVLKKLNEDLRQQSEELSKQATDLKTLNLQLEKQKEGELEKAIAQGKFEIASEFLHDIGNAMVGLGAHLNRINRVVDQNNLNNLKSLTVFLKTNQTAIAGAIGAHKAAALISVTEGFESTQTDNGAEIHKSITELLNIITHIQEILNIQRQLVRGHKGVHERKPVNLEHILYDCKSMLFASIDKKGIRFSINVQPGKYTIKGDHTKLMQVILNILKNSIEAINMDATEKIIAINMHTVDDVLELIITDNGQGFDAQTANLFFVRGFTTKKNGTGLGLYNIRTIIESHTGSFEISSNGPGCGAVSTIRFAL
ncbi:PAS domain-containing sensor histidine kinase [uncultured Mucilaginibacter sp.]|uniref:PAS domain-containing sensor histidine kinase n=1 Tax=uncultured Mucilaginibacter sp. TaxID=797541 RepID=UPI0025D2B7C4|nr:PAS domain-containing sensor histidine kinase [uncultured Mucilaginibacter sp.]